MTISSIAVKTAITAVALTALGLAAAMPASAHTSNMYTYITDSNDDLVPAYEGFATFGKSDGVTAPLATNLIDDNLRVRGMEVFNEKGVAIVYEEAGATVVTWDHSTGAAGVHVPLTLNGGTNYELAELDTLADGTTITIVATDADGFQYLIASVNPDTGVLTELVDLTDALADPEGAPLYSATALATDPTSGITYVFLTLGDLPYYLPVTVSTGVIGDITLFDGKGFDEGYIPSADFDAADGSLYFQYYNFDVVEDPLLELSRLGAPSTWPTAERQFISFAPSNGDEYIVEELALTIEHTTLAATGSELPIAAIVFGGTLAVIAGGVTVMVARRRREVATV